MKKLYLIVGVIIFYQFCSLAQLEFFGEQVPKSPIEQITESVTANIDSIMLDSIITSTMSSNNIPGLSALITKKEGGIVWTRNYGYANVAQNQPVEDSTLFLLASISKTILATAVMQFWEADSFDLDDPINDYLEGFQVINPYYPSDIITIKMLLIHTSSIRDNWTLLDPLNCCGDSPIPLDTFLINYFTPGGIYYNQSNFYNNAPGAEGWYSNVAPSILALLVERFSGMSFNQYCRENIFNPLEMHKTSFLLEELDTNNIATPYLWNGSQYIPYCHEGFPYYPIGSLRSNKIELNNFLKAYMNWGSYNGNTILDSLTVALILSDHLGYPIPGRGDYQGLLWYQSPAFRFSWGHIGGSYGCNTGMFFQQEEDWGIICFININNPTVINNLLNLLSDYAYLHGNVYALHPSIDRTYAKVNVDSVLFRTRFSNIYNHLFTPHLIYANTDSTIIDSLTLFDDGLHGDSLANDGIYGNYIPPISIEDFFKLGISTIDHQTNKYFITPDICRFTTAGPVIINNIEYTALSNFRYTIKPYLKNDGTTAAVTNLRCYIFCDDPWVTSLSPAYRNWPVMLPGEIKTSSIGFTVSYDSAAFPGYFNFKVEVLSDGWLYWTDSMQVIVTGVEDEGQVPLTFNLEQNYPNPFNPATVISLQLPVNSEVMLKVFDLLGNEIATLVDEYKPAGRYEVEFNPASSIKHPVSGVYFYQLKAGSFIETKKMLLIK